MDSLTAKVMILTSPGPKTRECYTGNYDQEEQDAQTYAAWLDEFFPPARFGIGETGW